MSSYYHYQILRLLHMTSPSKTKHPVFILIHVFFFFLFLFVCLFFKGSFYRINCMRIVILCLVIKFRFVLNFCIFCFITGLDNHSFG